MVVRKLDIVIDWYRPYLITGSFIPHEWTKREQPVCYYSRGYNGYHNYHPQRNIQEVIRMFTFKWFIYLIKIWTNL